MDIAAIRKNLGLSQAALAERLGVSQTTISRFESGELGLSPRTVLAMQALVNELATPTPREAA